MTVLIAGAGIGGLTLALSLHQIGVPCRVFEAVSELKPLGVGINLQPHAVREFAELGLLETLDAMAVRTAEVAYLSSHGAPIWSEPRGIAAGYRWPQLSVHRGALQLCLYREVLARLGPQAVQLGTAVHGCEETPTGVRVHLSARAPNVQTTVEQHSRPALLGSVDGTVLIAADGIHSRLRAAHYLDEGPPRWGGTLMWRGVSRAPSYLTGRTMAMAGCKARKFVCYPIAEAADGQAALVNWIADLAFPADYLWNREDWTRPGRLDDFLPEFCDWDFAWLDIPNVIRSAPSVFEYPMVDREPVEQWTFGPMTLLGDAAHAMYPIGSNGASQAILDARVLARELLHRGVTVAALEAYELERRPATARIVLANRGDGPDKILDLVEQLAPHGFADISDVLSQQELQQTANAYKQLAGMDVETLNQRPSIVAVKV